MTDKEKLIAEIIELQRRVGRVRRQSAPDVWMSLNLTIPQLKSLFFIINQRTANSRQLAAALKVTPSNVTGIVDRLVEQGLVSRRENPEDRRMLLLEATGKGEALVAELRERTMTRMSHFLARLSPQALSDLASGLSALAEAAETMEESESASYRS